MSPFFSIVIPVFNREERILKTVKSCLIQTYTDFEVIVIDDCSTDSTISRLSTLFDKRVKVYRNESNSERCFSRNKGVQLSMGEYVCFLDSDDLYMPDHLERLHQFIKSNKENNFMLFANSFVKNDKGELIKRIVPELNEADVFDYLLTYTPNPARVCVSRSILLLHSFDTQIPGMEDLDLWVRIAKEFPVYHIPSYTSVYVQHDDMYSVISKDRLTREIHMLTYIVEKNGLKSLTVKSSINRLFSMYYFHLSAIYFDNRQFRKTILCAIKSIWLCPRGYNGKTNKILLANIIYSTPILGMVVKRVFSLVRKLG